MEVTQTFQENTGPKVIKMCDENAKEIRNSTVNKATRNNMRHYGEKVFTKGGHIDSFPVKQLIREADAVEEERNVIKNKFKDRVELVEK